MSPKKYGKNLAEPEFGRTKKIHTWEHGDIYGKCHEVFINPNQFRTWNAILIYLTKLMNPVFGAIRNLISIKTKKCIHCFKDLENNGRYVAFGIVKTINFTANKYKTASEMELDLTVKKPVKRFYSGDIGENEFKFLCATQKRNLTIIFVLVNGVTCHPPSKVVLTENDLLIWDAVLDYMGKILDVPSGVQHLCTIYGDIILDPNELQHGYVYVALQYNEKFVKMDYLSLFTEYSNKKGLLLNIRPAEVKYGRKIPTLKGVRERKPTLDEKKSYTIPDAGDAVNVKFKKQIKEEFVEHDSQTKDLPKTDLTLAETQTQRDVKDKDAVTDSNIYSLYKVEQSMIQKEIALRGPETDKIRKGDSVTYITKYIEIHEKTTQTTMTTPALIAKINKTDGKQGAITQKNRDYKDTSVVEANKSDTKVENDIEFVSISVIVTKTYKVTGQATTETDTTNVDSTKSRQAHTYCSNITVSGTCSDKLDIITKIVNNVIIDTYKRVIQAEIEDIENGTGILPTTEKKNISINSHDNIADTKGKQVSLKNIESGTANTKRTDVIIPAITEKTNVTEKNKTQATETVADAKVNKNVSTEKDTEASRIGSSKPSCNKNRKVNESNYVYSGCAHVPAVHIQNKTYFNFCDLKSCRRDSCNDIKIRYCKKSNSALEETYFYETTPRTRENSCCICPVQPLGQTQSADMVESSTVQIQGDSKMTGVESILNKPVTTQRQDNIASDSYIPSLSTVEKPANTTMSLDSISGDLSETEIKESKTQKSTDDTKPMEPQKVKEGEVSITVNITKVSESSRPVIEHKIREQHLQIEKATSNVPSRVEGLTSKVTVNESFLEKLAYVKDTINDILKHTFQTLIDEGTMTDREEAIISEQQKLKRGTKDADEKPSTAISNKISKISSKYSKNIASKIMSKKTEEKQDEKLVPDDPQEIIKKSKPTKCMPVVRAMSKNAKNIQGPFDFECICESSRKKDSQCCICRKPPSNQNTVGETLSTTIKSKGSKDVATVIETTEDKPIKNKAVLDSARNRRNDKVADETQRLINMHTKKSEIVDGNRRKGFTVKTQSLPIKDFKGEQVKIERVFESTTRDGGKNEDFDSEVSGSESEISVDSIEESSCCVCVCPVKYRVNVGGVK